NHPALILKDDPGVARHQPLPHPLRQLGHGCRIGMSFIPDELLIQLREQRRILRSGFPKFQSTGFVLLVALFLARDFRFGFVGVTSPVNEICGASPQSPSRL
ncbi:MAG: hypothetical protein JWR69_1684, partial [Pedosphaera sp.]|nr:hypothetical protein [Pedosphaera sp.]